MRCVPVRGCKTWKGWEARQIIASYREQFRAVRYADRSTTDTLQSMVCCIQNLFRQDPRLNLTPQPPPVQDYALAPIQGFNDAVCCRSPDKEVQLIPYTRHTQLVDPVNAIPKRHEAHSRAEAGARKERAASYVVLQGYDAWRRGHLRSGGGVLQDCGEVRFPQLQGLNQGH